MQKDLSHNISWRERQRLLFIEWLLLWKQKLTTRMLVEAFGISRQQASTDIKNYIHLFPGNIKPYSPKDGCYKPTIEFQPAFANNCPNRYIELCGNLSENNSLLHTVNIIKRTIDDGVLPTTLYAIDANLGLRIMYASAKNPIGQKRIIFPTAIIHCANRMHVRAFCVNNNEYRDFVLSRILLIPEIVQESKDHLPEDDNWEQFIDIVIEPNPSLPNNGQKLIAREYNIQGIKKVAIRKALVHYFLQDNLIPHSEETLQKAQNTPWAYPLAVHNWNEISTLLFDGNTKS